MVKLSFQRLLLVIMFAVVAAVALAGNLTVTSPTNNSYLGLNNTLNFNITGAVLQVTVTATIVGPTGGTSTVTGQFQPNVQGQITNSLAVNFSNSSPSGAYTITVAATEPGNTYNTVTLSVTVVTIGPKITDYSPNSGQFMKGVIPIKATILSSFVKTWKVQINGQDIPNNTGTGNTVAVNWDTSNLQTDGAQTITISVTDLANNTASQTINITVDRVPPTITVHYPSNNATFFPRSLITIIFDVQDESSSAMDYTGVDVLVENQSGAPLMRATRILWKAISGTTDRWVGRIVDRSDLLPNTFNLVISAVDKAGNVGTPQTIKVKIAY